MKFIRDRAAEAGVEACIAAVRKAETMIEFWDVEPHMELLGKREKDEAYLAAQPGEQYLLYFTDGGSVDLDLSDASGSRPSSESEGVVEVPSDARQVDRRRFGPRWSTSTVHSSVGR